MLKIGFIDYYLDEWHANNYPEMLKKFSDGEMAVTYVYAYTDPPQGRISNEEWVRRYEVERLDTVQEVVEKSDCIIVLSPDNPEMHEELCRIPLASGKRVYVDKTFAPDKPSALRIFENADRHGTPCFSSSALRFSDELDTVDPAAIDKIYTEGPGTLDIESIHQIEMIVRLMKAPATQVMFLEEGTHPSYLIRFADGRTAQCYHRDDPNFSFRLTAVDQQNHGRVLEIKSDFFGNLIRQMVRFFRTGEVPVPHSQTVDVIGIRTAIIVAAKTPFTWVNI